MMIVQLPPRRADRDRAPPPVARKDRIAMARPALPFRLDVQEKRFEPADQRIARMREGEDCGSAERDHGNGRREGDLRVRELPLRTRTQLPLVQRRRCAAWRRYDRHEPVARAFRAEIPSRAVTYRCADGNSIKR